MVAVVGAAGELDPAGRAYLARAAVRADEVAGAHLFGAGRGLEGGRDTVAVLLRSGQSGVELHEPAELLDSAAERGVGVVLGDQQRVRVGHVVAGLARVEHGAGQNERAEVDPEFRVVRAVLDDLVQDAEILEDLLGAGLDSFGAGAGETLVGCADDPNIDVAVQQICGDRESGGAASDDQDSG